MKIIIGSDHRGILLKKFIIDYFSQKHQISDIGTFSELEPIDYPDIAQLVCQRVKKDDAMGILICSTGQGMAISANRYSGIRCALCFQPEIAKMARFHNNANICSLGTSFFPKNKWINFIKIINAFLETEFEGGRHQKRLEKIEENVN